MDLMTFPFPLRAYARSTATSAWALDPSGTLPSGRPYPEVDLGEGSYGAILAPSPSGEGLAVDVVDNSSLDGDSIDVPSEDVGVAILLLLASTGPGVDPLAALRTIGRLLG